jgi:primosomal protein N' (replication factor Y)
VGVINADVGLNLPDFRAAERVFQLLCQVSGRAGRGIIPGKSIIQTFNPDHYAIKCAAKHDYKSFFYLENKYRRQFGYPPYNKMVRLVYSHRDLNTSRHVAESMAATFNNIKESKGAVDLKIIGPLPPYYAKLRGRYQMQIILLGQDIHSILKDMYFPKGWILDVDPVGVL